MKLFCIALVALTLGTFTTSCSDDKPAKTEVEAPVVPTVDPHGLKMAFYESDSLNEKFTYLKEQDSLLKKKQEKFEKEIMGRQRSLEQKYNELVMNQQKMLMSASDLEKMKMALERQQASLQNYQQTEGGKLQEEAIEMQTVLQNKVTEFAKRYCEKYKLDMLIMHAQGGQFTYYNPKMDVTKSFIEFVNAEQAKMDKSTGE
jgi:Skp family chaperone for outer membrane proteins